MTMELEASYKVVSYGPGLVPENQRQLIFASWLRTLRTGNDMFKLVDPPAFYDAYTRVIPAIIATAEVRFAVLSDDHDVILGYAVHRGQTLDYWYVKSDFRKIGIGSSLLPEFDTVSHVTKTWLLIWGRERYKHVKFNPFK